MTTHVDCLSWSIQAIALKVLQILLKKMRLRTLTCCTLATSQACLVGVMSPHISRWLLGKALSHTNYVRWRRVLEILRALGMRKGMLICGLQVIGTCHSVLGKLLMRVTVITQPCGDVRIAATSRVAHLPYVLRQRVWVILSMYLKGVRVFKALRASHACIEATLSIHSVEGIVMRGSWVVVAPLGRIELFWIHIYLLNFCLLFFLNLNYLNFFDFSAQT